MGLNIRDIAAAAGVSPATVSRALRGMDNVDVSTREHVIAVARALDYAVSPVASRLATGRSGTLGIVTPYVGGWYFAELFAGIEAALKPFDLDVLIHTTEEPTGARPSTEAHVRLRRRVDAALVIGLAPDSKEIAGLAGLGIPLVLIGSQVDGVASVSIDDRADACRAVQHLLDLGHRRVGLISGRRLPTGFVPENDRLAGYLDALSAAHLAHPTSLREVGEFTTAGGERAMSVLLARQPRPTAVFCMSDQMAYGALRAMSRAGVGTGTGDGAIAVMGFDDHELATTFDLSTVAQPVRAIGALGVDLVMEQLDGRQPRVIVLPTELRVRASTQGSVTNR
ncbi:LacI family DNA-binding transcriptional regulator [uncultured Jatrophihabitans sp.]|uniref:LacI family DNA-binding transcriptional regulator n=1 Tax=uncultured Jatrophihabitans sp. TaxID=1610747 RepID=UPI0035CC2A55